MNDLSPAAQTTPAGSLVEPEITYRELCRIWTDSQDPDEESGDAMARLYSAGFHAGMEWQAKLLTQPSDIFPTEYADSDGGGIRIIMEPADETGQVCWVVRNSRYVNPCHEFPTPEAAYAAHKDASAPKDVAAPAPAGSPFMVPPANCSQRLMREGKPYPKSGCEACGDMSPLWRQCNAGLEIEAAQPVTPASSMVERVASRLNAACGLRGGQWDEVATDMIREIADAARAKDSKRWDPSGVAQMVTWEMVAQWLEQEADRG